MNTCKWRRLTTVTDRLDAIAAAGGVAAVTEERCAINALAASMAVAAVTTRPALRADSGAGAPREAVAAAADELLAELPTGAGCRVLIDKG
jgi:hypothetical protein